MVVTVVFVVEVVVVVVFVVEVVVVVVVIVFVVVVVAVVVVVVLRKGGGNPAAPAVPQHSCQPATKLHMLPLVRLFPLGYGVARGRRARQLAFTLLS